MFLPLSSFSLLLTQKPGDPVVSFHYFTQNSYLLRIKAKVFTTVYALYILFCALSSLLPHLLTLPHSTIATLISFLFYKCTIYIPFSEHIHLLLEPVPQVDIWVMASVLNVSLLSNVTFSVRPTLATLHSIQYPFSHPNYISYLLFLTEFSCLEFITT